MYIKVKSFDTLFFRGGRPFSAGSDTWADKVFPPFPSTFYGALRSYLIFKWGTLGEFRSKTHKHQEVIGYVSDEKVEYGALKLNGLFLCQEEIPFFPLPLDLVRLKGKDIYTHLLEFKEKSKLFVSNYPLANYLIWQRKEQVDDPEGWLEINDFKDYLKNNKIDFTAFMNQELFTDEQKIGITRERTTFTSKKRYLSRIPLIRLQKDTFFIIEIEGVEKNLIPDSGDVLQLGGEGKAATLEILSSNPLRDIKDLDLDFSNGFFKIYLATPAVFKNGWFPEWINPNKEFTGKYSGIEVQLFACAIGRPVPVGGWDLVKNVSKPLRKAVSAGSVYYFKICNSFDSKAVKDTFHLKNISDKFEDIDYSKEGFGLAIVGEVKL
ncbi:type III-B CRISPR module-associated protein Cmr3 [Bacteroidetes/Chlorobi group bacterium Naka2016]|jgi:CRISPR-associated protein Cmr3|nr:MAG: type III-B CRISPR module-associated protein Cmr3 [Bacteroidetes/Chlorobi group bacterium Naka2016]